MPRSAAELAAAIAAWLPEARWFAGKGSSLERVAVAEAVPVAAGIVLCLVDTTADGATVRYVVPVDSESGADAAATPALAGKLVDAITSGRGIPSVVNGSACRLVGHAVESRTGPTAQTEGIGLIEVEPLGTDASNTSLRVRQRGRDCVVKLLRRCQSGIQPEVEVGEFLATETSWRGTPRFCGWLEHVAAATDARDQGAVTVLATLHEFTPGCTGAWETLLELATDGGLAGPQRQRLLDAVAALGRLTAAMHDALASRPDVPAFAPVRASAAEWDQLVAGLAAHARSVFDDVAEAAERHPPVQAVRLRGIVSGAPQLIARLEGPLAASGGVPLIRVHGDYHLGQVLMPRGAGEPLVIDFEGEPARSLDERRRKLPAAKDVAGMCRSFDYLLRCAAAAGGPVYREDDRVIIEARFLDAYGAIATGKTWWPADPAAAAGLVTMFTLDKAIYELAYELHNRPEWVDVPLTALEGMLAG
jgi:trehalose synthase-fused probable maltokinase